MDHDDSAGSEMQFITQLARERRAVVPPVSAEGNLRSAWCSEDIFRAAIRRLFV